jgi:DNA/RNA-binding domain of Phe-tRNA-synthetase-like protein
MEAPAELRGEIAAHCGQIAQSFRSSADIRATREVGAYSEILRRVGVHPRKESPTVQKLLQMALKRGTLPAINNLVDAYNLVSVRTRCSLGAHDLDRISLPVALRMFTGDEQFTPLGTSQPVNVSANEFGYVDADRRVLCRLDVLQAEFSKVTLETKNALLIIEGTADHAPEVLAATFDDCASTIQKHCGGTSEVVARAID